LLLEESLQVFLGLIVKVVFLAEFLSELLRCITFVHYDPLLLIRTKVDIDEEQWWVRIIEIIILIFVFFLISDQLLPI